MKTVENPNYEAHVSPDSEQFWVAHLVVGAESGYPFGDARTTMLDHLVRDVPDDVRAFGVETTAGKAAHFAFELNGEDDDFASCMIAGLAWQSLLKLDIDPANIAYKKGELRTGKDLLTPSRPRLGVIALETYRSTPVYRLRSTFDELKAMAVHYAAQEERQPLYHVA